MEVDRTFSQWSIGSPRVKWSAVFAGWSVGLGVQLILILFGLGVGAWAVEAREPDPTGGVPVGAGIWTGLSMLLSAFIGGYVTARVSGSADRADGMYHGVVVWSVNWLIFAWLTTTAMSAMIAGVFSPFGTALDALGQARPVIVLPIGEMSKEDLRREVESAAQAIGLSEIQSGAAATDTAPDRGSIRRGQPVNHITDSALGELRDKLVSLDRTAAIRMMVDRFGLSESQAGQVVRHTIGLLGAAQDRVQRVEGQTLDRMGSFAMWLSLLALAALALSAIGGVVGTPDESLVEASSRTESYRADLRRAG